MSCLENPKLTSGSATGIVEVKTTLARLCQVTRTLTVVHFLGVGNKFLLETSPQEALQNCWYRCGGTNDIDFDIQRVMIH